MSERPAAASVGDRGFGVEICRRKGLVADPLELADELVDLGADRGDALQQRQRDESVLGLQVEHLVGLRGEDRPGADGCRGTTTRVERPLHVTDC